MFLSLVKKTFIAGAFALGLAFALSAAENPELKLDIAIDKKDGIYPKGGPVKLTVKLQKNGQYFAGQKMGYYLYTDARSKKLVPFTSNGKEQTFSIPIPGEYLTMDVVALDDKGAVYTYKKGKRKVTVRKTIGVVADPFRIKPAMPEPADFGKYWEDALKELAAIPVRYTMKEVEVPAKWKGKFRCYDVEGEFLKGMRPVRAYLTVPVVAGKKKFPVVVYFHSAGIRSSAKRFLPGVITMDVNAHGVENGHKAPYYQQLGRTEMKQYLYVGYTDKYKCVFRSVFLRMKRALDIVKQHPLYDGKNLILAGGSQGGALAVITASFDKDVSLVHAVVPALGDQGGALIPTRRAGWPYYIAVRNGKVVNRSIAGSAVYFDTAYFAKNVKARVLLTIGLSDTVCVPTAVLSIYNNLPAGNKDIMICPGNGHWTSDMPEFTRLLKKFASSK